MAVGLGWLLQLAACTDRESELTRHGNHSETAGGKATGDGGSAGGDSVTHFGANGGNADWVAQGGEAGRGGEAGTASQAGTAGQSGTAGHSGTSVDEDCTVCTESAERLGYRSCVCQVPDRMLWASISTRTSTPFELRATKFTLPAREDARLPAVFLDANAFQLHYEFLRQSFPERFGNLGTREYLDMIEDPEHREFYAGALTEYALGGEAVLYGFTLWDDPADPLTTITCDQARTAYAMLDARFDLLPLFFVPSTENQREALGTCDVPSYDSTRGVDYEAYTEGVGYGTLRRLTLPQLAAAADAEEFGWQDILVMDQAPTDVETVISGAVTGTQQGALSHLNVRSAARGTPNCYIQGAYELLEDWEGRLVRLECGNGYFTVDSATLEEASAFWDTLRPPPLTIPTPDRDYDSTIGLLAVPTDTPKQRAAAVRRFGSKGTNLATLYQRTETSIQLPGFLISMRSYLDFFENRTWTVDLGSGPESHTFSETVATWIREPRFGTDGAWRRERLAALRSAMENTPVGLDLSAPIREAFAGDTTMLRFRSSSNAEDALTFSGAGLYDSESGCLADDLDGDEVGPSLCDPNRSSERTVARALAKVWASLWNVRAYNEREWYGIDQLSSAMGVLVDLRIDDELANIVAFTGNPSSPGDERYLVNAQAGELDVVLPDPGVFPEELWLSVTDGRVSDIERVRGSSELPKGTWIVDDDTLEELGTLMWQISQVFPVDAVPPEGTTVLLDTEWKICADGSLVIKQVRPFLRD